MPAMSKVAYCALTLFIAVDALSFPKAPSTLFTLEWSQVGCPAGYSACADLEFCQFGAQFAYRLIGQPCVPFKAPVIRVEPGKKYQLQLHNSASDPANLHTHGPHVQGDGNGDDITRVAAPGHSLKYTWDIPASHRGGTFWYHPHVHEYTYKAVQGGAFGMLIVEEHSVMNTLPASFVRFMRNEILLVAGRVDSVWVGNGNVQENLYLTRNEWHRLRIVGANPLSNMNPQLDIDAKSNCEAYPIQHDGVWSWRIQETLTSSLKHFLSGANRLDLAIKCPTLGTFDVDVYGGVVARLNVGAGSTSIAWPFKNAKDTTPRVQFDTRAKGAEASLRAPYLSDYSTGVVLPQNLWTMGMTAAGIKLADGTTKLYDPKVPLLTRKYGELQQWSLNNVNQHTFHLHVYHMQVVSGCSGYSTGEYYDAILGGSGCTVRFVPTEHAGRATFHCHVLPHEDAGTMGWMNVTGGPASAQPNLFQVAEILKTEVSSTLCIADAKCFPKNECGSNAGVTRCGKPCTLLAANVPKCIVGVCTTTFKCAWSLSPTGAEAPLDGEGSALVDGEGSQQQGASSSAASSQGSSVALLGLIGLVGLVGLIPMAAHFFKGRRSHSELAEIEIMQMELSAAPLPMNSLVSPAMSSSQLATPANAMPMPSTP